MTERVDLSRALLLPEVVPPTDAALLSLALFWEQLIVPTYVERHLGSAPQEIERSEVAQRLVNEGVLVYADRSVDLDEILPFARNPPLGHETVTLAVDDELLERFQLTAADRQIGADTIGALVTGATGELSPAALSFDDMHDVVAAHVARHLLGRADDARKLAARENLAPVAVSRLSHVGSMLCEPVTDEPVAENSLLSVAVQAFQCAPGTSVEDVLRFRSKAAATRAHFRGQMSDLSVGLRDTADPIKALSLARDRYNNRVLSALGQLEEALGVNRVQFVARSFQRVTAVSFAPVTPKSAIENGAHLTAEALTYGFSKRRLVADHPYGYLYEVGREFGSDGSDALPPLLGTSNPRIALRELVRAEGLPMLLDRFLGS